MPVSPGISSHPLRPRFTLRMKTGGLLPSPAMFCTLLYPDKDMSPGSGVTRSKVSVFGDFSKMFTL